ncbi:unnamed protein product [Diabrotica balteata]|uniref:CHK kinase-like domain-containing protein n=1 Tax=Diabrotica balteata TaxID=107213 RepID=A0A9N9SZM0_DIABA|nr:unnamed protein product [Diabrotica balteata]
MDTKTEDVKFWIDKMMSEKGITKYIIDISGTSSKGDGYLGEINFVKVPCDTKEGEKRVFDVVIKSAKTNDDLRKNTPIVETYEREIAMYMKVAPAIRDFQNEYAIENTFSHFAECFTTCLLHKKEAVLLQNLNSLGFSIHDRKVPQNFEHISFVFRTYALWHGCTLALKIKKPELFKNLTEGMTDLYGKFIKMADMLPLWQQYFNIIIKILREKGEDKVADKIIDKAGDIETIMTKMTLEFDKEAEQEAENDFSKPVDVVLIDLQLARVASPVTDLSYYLYSVADKSSLDKFDVLLSTYYATLSNYLSQYNIDCEHIVTLKRLRESWKKYGRFGLLCAPFIVRAELSEDDEVIEFTDKAAEKSVNEIRLDDIKRQDEYNQRMVNVFKHFSEEFL